MKKRTFQVVFTLAAFALVTGCDVEGTPGGDSIPAYVPVYGAASASEIVMTSPQTVTEPGKIHVYGKYLLVNEKMKGIHIFDNTNPADPLNIGFLQMLGNSDMAIRNDVLYADHLGNLVALTTSDFTTIEETGRLPLRNWLKGVPPPSHSYFECVDPDKGLVVDWKRTNIKNPRCYAQ